MALEINDRVKYKLGNGGGMNTGRLPASPFPLSMGNRSIS